MKIIWFFSDTYSLQEDIIEKKLKLGVYLLGGHVNFWGFEANFVRHVVDVVESRLTDCFSTVRRQFL